MERGSLPFFLELSVTQRLSSRSAAFRRTALACFIGMGCGVAGAAEDDAEMADQSVIKLNSPANVDVHIHVARRPWETDADLPLTPAVKLLTPKAAETESPAEPSAPAVTRTQPRTVSASSIKLRPIAIDPPTQAKTGPPAKATVKPPSVRPAEPLMKLADPATPQPIAGKSATAISSTRKPDSTRVPNSMRPTSPAPATNPPRTVAAPDRDPDSAWVAREAINRVAPLLDPVPPRMVPKKPVTPSVPSREIPSRETSDTRVKADRVDDRDEADVPDTSDEGGLTLGAAHPAQGPPAIKPPTRTPPTRTPPTREVAEPSDSSVTARENVRGGVTVRSLKIQRDGALTGSRRAAAVPDESATSDEAVAPRSVIGSSTEARVGDLVEPDPQAAESPETEDGGSPREAARMATSDLPLDFTGRPAVPINVTRESAALRMPIRQVLQYYYHNPEIADGRSNWGMMHAMLVYGADTKVRVGRKTHSTIAWVAGNNICRGKRLLIEGPHGIEADNGIGLQGHQGQLLMVLGLTGVPRDYPLYANGNKYSVDDLIRREAETCRSGEELTFTLIGLAHYLGTEESWTSTDGERWDFERLIAEELSQPIVGAACGGTHRLMGFAHALRKRRMEGLPVEGQWARAERFLEDFVAYTYRLQNRDGSMSTSWFEGREDNGDLDRKIQTTGHMAEWLITVTPDEELQNPRLVAAIRFLATSMRKELDRDWSIGPKGHALRSLAMYYDRVYGEGPAWRQTAAASSRTASRPSSRYQQTRR